MKNFVIIFILSICFSTSVFAQNPSNIIEVDGVGTYVLVSKQMTPCIKELDSLALEVKKTMERADSYQKILDTLITRAEYIQSPVNDLETRKKVGSELILWVIYINDLHNKELDLLRKQSERMIELRVKCEKE